MSRRLPAPMLVLALFLVLTALLCLPVWLHPTSSWIGSSGDPNLLMWLLRWAPWAIQHGMNPLFTDRVIAPRGVNLMWNSSVLLPALVISPITLLFGVIAAYNTLMTVGMAVSAWCCYLAARRWLRSERAAIVAGLVYGFSPFLLTQLVLHASMIIAWEPPLLLVLLDDILVRQKRGPVKLGVLLGCLVGAQFYVMEDVVLSSALIAILMLCILVMKNRRHARTAWRRPAVSLGVGLAVMLAIIGYPLAFQLFGPYPVHGQFHPTGTYVADPANLVIPTSIQWLSSPTLDSLANTFPGFAPERTLYIGLPLLVIVTVYVWRNRKEPVIQAFALGAVVALVLSLGGHLHLLGHVSGVPLPASILEALPFLNDMILSRFALYIDLFVALLFGFVVRDLLATSNLKRGGIGAAVALTLVAVTLFPRVPIPTTPDATPRFFTATVSKVVPQDAVVLIAPFAYDPGQAAAMQWQLEADFRYKMPEGYIISGVPSPVFPYGPPISRTFLALEAIRQGWRTPEMEETSRTRQDIYSDLKRWNVQGAVVGPMDHRAETVRFLQWLLGTPPWERDGVQLWVIK